MITSPTPTDSGATISTTPPSTANGSPRAGFGTKCATLCSSRGPWRTSMATPNSSVSR